MLTRPVPPCAIEIGLIPRDNLVHSSRASFSSGRETMHFDKGSSAALILSLLAFASAAPGQVVHVDAAAPSGGDGATWATAYRHVQDALDEAGRGGVVEIRVAQGRYTPDLDEDSDGDGQPEHVAGSRFETFQLLSGVSLRGGYRGAFDPNGDDPDDRDPIGLESVLSGDLAGDDGPDFAQNSENSLHVVTGSGVELSAVLDGFTVSGGNASIAGTHEDGAGLNCDAGSPLVTNCRFEANAALDNGGAVWVHDGGAGLFELCAFVGNRANDGGAIAITGMLTAPILRMCAFEQNEAVVDGGAAFFSSASVSSVEDCSFVGNRAASGGACAVTSANSATTVVDFGYSAFSNNEASFGGAIRVLAGGDARLTSCVLGLNTADLHGGAVGTNAASLTLFFCALNGNAAGGNGGALKLGNGSALLMIGCTLIGNRAENYGGGLEVGPNGGGYVSDCFLSENQSVNFAGGGANAFNGGSLTVRRTAFVLNRGASGGGLFFASTAGPCAASDCVLIGNEAATFGGGVLANAVDSAIYNCAFYGNRARMGGGLDAGFAGGPAAVMNCVFSGNRADLDPNGVGGGANFTGPNPHQMANCTFVDNVASAQGAALSVDGGGLEIANSIVWFHEVQPINVVPPSHVTIRWSAIEGGWPGDGNVSLDPLLVDRLGPDGFPGTGDEDLRLTNDGVTISPAIDAGNSELILPDYADVDEDGDAAEATPTDISRWFRVANAPGAPETGVGDPPVDMGAYEARCEGDLDGDNDVDQSDLGVLLSSFGCGWPPCPADLDGDGDTDQADLGILLANYGAVCR